MMNHFKQHTTKTKEVVNFENLIAKLNQFDKNDDMLFKTQSQVSNFYINDKQLPDLNLSISSQAMSSFLHDFDLDRATIVNTLLPQDNDESHFCAETPINNRSMTTHQMNKGAKGPGQ